MDGTNGIDDTMDGTGDMTNGIAETPSGIEQRTNGTGKILDYKDKTPHMVKRTLDMGITNNTAYVIVDENVDTTPAAANMPFCWTDCCRGRESKFKTMNAYREHVHDQHGWCGYCYTIFATPELAEQHLMDTPFFCRQCNVCLPSRREAAKHTTIPRPGWVSRTGPPVISKITSNEGSSAPFPYCGSCQTQYLKPSPGQFHVCGATSDEAKQQEREPRACAVCTAVFDSVSALRGHIADAHHGCACGEYFDTEKALFTHKSTHLHGICGKWVEDGAAQTRMEPRMGRDDSTVFHCAACDYKFTTVDELVAHFQRVHFGCGYTCHTCNTRFSGILPFKWHLEYKPTHSRTIAGR